MPGCRREFDELAKVTDRVTLDESPFCRKCSPDVETPKLSLTSKYLGGEPQVVAGVNPNDLRILRELFAGKVVHITFNDAEQPLKDQLPRLQELLGVKTEPEQEE